jgi:20S proteasome alpha/beta subunit
MTLIINVTTPDGIVMASDSRQSQRNIKQITRISTNTADKLFQVNKQVIVGTAGLAFFPNEKGMPTNVSKYINDFSNDNDLDELTVKEIAYKLHDYINARYPWEKQLDLSAQQLKIEAEQKGAQVLSIEKLEDSIEFKIKQVNGRIEEGHLDIEAVDILVSGYNDDGTTQTYELRCPGEITLERDVEEYGSTWVGQGDVVSRIILGYDSKMLNMPVFQRNNNQKNELITQLHGLEYNIQWGLMTLQDAINLAVFLIKSTQMIQRYADGINMDIGDVQNVGGPIDIAVIRDGEGIEWINKKQLYYPQNI